MVVVHCPAQNQGNDKTAYLPTWHFPRELRNKDQEMLAPANFAGQLRASSVLRMGGP